MKENYRYEVEFFGRNENGEYRKTVNFVSSSKHKLEEWCTFFLESSSQLYMYKINKFDKIV